MVSRFAASKDQETVIKALRFLDEDVTLRLVGEGDNFEHCKQVAIEENVANRVEFLGSRSDIPELIGESYLGIQSSNWEGFGLTAVEFMAAGKPVIVSDVDGLRQVVEGAGLIFEKGNIKALVKEIKSLLSDPFKYAVVSRNCHDRAKQYDIRLMANKYLDVYKNLIKLK